MSTAAKTTLATTALGTISIILFVHFQQTADKAVRPIPLLTSPPNLADLA